MKIRELYECVATMRQVSMIQKPGRISYALNARQDFSEHSSVSNKCKPCCLYHRANTGYTLSFELLQPTWRGFEGLGTSQVCFVSGFILKGSWQIYRDSSTWGVEEGSRSVHGKKENNAASKVGLWIHSSTASPLASSTLGENRWSEAGLQKSLSC